MAEPKLPVDGSDRRTSSPLPFCGQKGKPQREEEKPDQVELLSLILFSSLVLDLLVAGGKVRSETVNPLHRPSERRAKAGGARRDVPHGALGCGSYISNPAPIRESTPYHCSARWVPQLGTTDAFNPHSFIRQTPCAGAAVAEF